MPIVSCAFLWGNLADFEVKRDYCDFSYEVDISKEWKARANYTYNKLNRFIGASSRPASQFKANSGLYEFTVCGELSPNLSLISGYVSENI